MKTHAVRGASAVAIRAVMVAVACASSACGGANATDLFDGPATTDPTGNPGQTSDAGDGPPTSNADATVPGTDASTRVDGGTPDATTTVDAGTRDAGPPHTPTSVACGSQRCTIPAQDCCRTTGFSGDPTYACVNKGACFGFQSLVIPCDDGADCATLGSPGQVCCSAGNATNVTEVRCRAAADCVKPNRANLCDPYANLATACPNSSGPGASCTVEPDAAFPYSVCVP